jgi:hypothetical protein
VKAIEEKQERIEREEWHRQYEEEQRKEQELKERKEKELTDFKILFALSNRYETSMTKLFATRWDVNGEFFLPLR